MEISLDDSIEENYERNENKLFNCDKCEFAHKVETELQNHITTIHEQAKYSCELCEYTSQNSSNLEKHIENMHEKTNFLCLNCKKNSDKFCIECKLNSCNPCIVKINEISKEHIDSALNKGILDKAFEKNEFICKNCLKEKFKVVINKYELRKEKNVALLKEKQKRKQQEAFNK